jgi:dihydrofolate reductase
MDKNRGIGKGNSLPWHLPKELAYFKEVTKDNLVVFGKNTWESLPKKPLPDRKNAVMTRDIRFHESNVWTFHDMDDILWFARHDKNYKDKEVFICGGQSLYEQCLPYADRLYVTRIDAEFDCDTFFPAFDSSWYRIIDSPIPIIDNGYKLDFAIYERS